MCLKRDRQASEVHNVLAGAFPAFQHPDSQSWGLTDILTLFFVSGAYGSSGSAPVMYSSNLPLLVRGVCQIGDRGDLGLCLLQPLRIRAREPGRAGLRFSIRAFCSTMPRFQPFHRSSL